MRIRNCLIVMAALVGVLALPAEAQTKRRSAKDSQPASEPANPQFAQAVRDSIEHALTAFESNGDIKAAKALLRNAFDLVVACGPATDKALFRDAGCAVRLIELIEAAPEASRVGHYQFLRENPALARSLAFLVRPLHDKPEKVLDVLARLRARHEKRLNDYANLAAAVCVVHDEPLLRKINENSARSADPVALFEFFVAYEKQMFFGLRDVPAELLVYIVDSTASLDDMQWAVQRYAGDRNIGQRYFDVKYDVDHFREGDTKRVTAAGWTLPNILKFGGVCADQAYFAVSIGKSIGVPATYTRGASGEVAHAWVGFLQTDGKRAWWNFNSGRHAAYQGVRGSVEDPQTRRMIPDSYVALLADFVMAKELDRQAAIAMTDAAERLLEFFKSKKQLAAAPPAGIESPQLRQPETEPILALLEAGMTACPGHAQGWFVVRQLATDGRLTLEDKKKWAGILDRLCGKHYPDFYLTILEPMIQSVEDVREQNALWNAAFANFQHRHDLAAAVRMAQAEMWRKNKQFEKAGQCYEDVIDRYANAGPFVLSALVEAEKILREARDGPRILLLYDHAWSKTLKPQEMAEPFRRQSNWFRVGSRYAGLLDEAGRGQEAARIRAALQQN